MVLNIAYPGTKFYDCSCSHSRNMIGVHQNLNSSHNLTTPLSVMLCHPGLVIATVNPYAKFEVSVTTSFEDIR